MAPSGMDEAEKVVETFYRDRGWEIDNGVTEDARRWEDLRPSSSEYVSRCRQRVQRHIRGSGKILDMASGPIQYEEYLAYSAGFKERHCVDLSPTAIEAARHKIGDHGVFWTGSFFDYEAPDDKFDCAVSLHTIYHIAADRQEDAVRKLLRVTSGPVVIVYSNPNAILSRLKRIVSGKAPAADLYFHAHPSSWWERFRDVADVRVYPWRSFAANEMRLIPSGFIGKLALKALFYAEEVAPRFFAENFRYNMIVLQKRSRQT